METPPFVSKERRSPDVPTSFPVVPKSPTKTRIPPRHEHEPEPEHKHKYKCKHKHEHEHEARCASQVQASLGWDASVVPTAMFAVCDGHGKHGHKASVLVARHLQESDMADKDVRLKLGAALQDAEKRSMAVCPPNPSAPLVCFWLFQFTKY